MHKTLKSLKTSPIIKNYDVLDFKLRKEFRNQNAANALTKLEEFNKEFPAKKTRSYMNTSHKN